MVRKQPHERKLGEEQSSRERRNIKQDKQHASTRDGAPGNGFCTEVSLQAGERERRYDAIVRSEEGALDYLTSATKSSSSVWEMQDAWVLGRGHLLEGIVGRNFWLPAVEMVGAITGSWQGCVAGKC